jgi:hypothetical protein
MGNGFADHCLADHYLRVTIWSKRKVDAFVHLMENEVGRQTVLQVKEASYQEHQQAEE